MTFQVSCPTCPADRAWDDTDLCASCDRCLIYCCDRPCTKRAGSPSAELTADEIEAAAERVRLGELSDAVRSAGRALWIYRNGSTVEEYDDAWPHDVWTDVQCAAAALAAARPHIEAEVRAKVAAEIRALPLLLDDTPHRYCTALDVAGIALTDDTSYAEVADAGYLAARSDAARVAEGGERRGE